MNISSTGALRIEERFIVLGSLNREPMGIAHFAHSLEEAYRLQSTWDKAQSNRIGPMTHQSLVLPIPFEVLVSNSTGKVTSVICPISEDPNKNRGLFVFDGGLPSWSRYDEFPEEYRKRPKKFGT